MNLFNNYKDRLDALMNKGNKSLIKEDTATLENKNQIVRSVIRLQDQYSNEELASLAFFEKIYGFNELKLNIFSALTADEQTNTLLFGPPASAKSLFMKIIEEKCNDVMYFDASNASGAGLIEALYTHQEAKIVCIDEIGMLNKNDLDALRGLLNDGRVIKTLKKKRYDFTMKCKIIATTNDMDMPRPIISRFQTYEIPAYTDEEFVKVSQFCLANKFNAEIAGMIAAVLLANKKKDIRQVLNVSRLIKANDSEEQIVKKIETTIKYSVSSNTDYN